MFCLLLLRVLSVLVSVLWVVLKPDSPPVLHFNISSEWDCVINIIIIFPVLDGC